jgi:hypothetical protein
LQLPKSSSSAVGSARIDLHRVIERKKHCILFQSTKGERHRIVRQLQGLFRRFRFDFHYLTFRVPH